MKRNSCFIVLLLTAFSLCWSSQKDIPFDEIAAWRHVKDLSADLMEGRDTGQPGGKRAQEYVAKHFKEWGIEPAGEDGTYFQNVTFNSFRICGKADLEVLLNKERRSFPYQDGWRILPQSGSCRGEFEVVFAGYGISAPQSGYDDYKGLDVSGRMVLISDKIPMGLAAKAGKQASIENRIASARGHGARGIFFFNNTYIVKQYLELSTRPFLFDEHFVIITIEDRVVDFMYKNMKKEGGVSLRQIEGTLQPESYAMGCKVSLSVSTEADPKATSRNVLGQIPGTDDGLKNEYIVISAHLDHIGISPVGEIMHGANDNASGSAVVMETARCMKALGIKPKRTVVFALWTGEELGLVGSKYYTKHPLFPLDMTMVNINMDMVGQGKNKIKVYGKSYFPDLWEYLTDNLPKGTKESIIPIDYSPGGSDHSAFQDVGIPGLLVQSEGPHFKVHRSEDAIDFIDTEALKTTGRFILDAINVLGSCTPDFIDPKRREIAQLKRQTYIDYRCPMLKDLPKSADPKGSIIDLKLAMICGNPGLSGDALGLDILGKTLTDSRPVLGSDSLSFYSSINGLLTSDMRPNTMTLLAGVQGTQWMENDPQWGRYLRRNDLAFVLESGSSSVFSEKGMTKAGNERIQRLLGQGLVVIMHDLTQPQAAGALRETTHPLIIVDKALPGDEVLDLIPRSDSAIGLIYEDGDDPAVLMKKIGYLRGKIGMEHIVLFSRCSVEIEEGKNELLDLMALLLSSEYQKKDIYYLFSGSFLRILCNLRGEEEPPVY